MDSVVADLQPHRALGLGLADAMGKGVARLEAGHPALVGLFELVAPNGIGEEVGEVREQIQVVVKPIRHHLRGAGVALAVPLAGEAVTLAVAAVGGSIKPNRSIKPESTARLAIWSVGSNRPCSP